MSSIVYEVEGGDLIGYLPGTSLLARVGLADVARAMNAARKADIGEAEIAGLRSLEGIEVGYEVGAKRRSSPPRPAARPPKAAPARRASPARPARAAARPAARPAPKPKPKPRGVRQAFRVVRRAATKAVNSKIVRKLRKAAAATLPMGPTILALRAARPAARLAKKAAQRPTPATRVQMPLARALAQGRITPAQAERHADERGLSAQETEEVKAAAVVQRMAESGDPEQTEAVQAAADVEAMRDDVPEDDDPEEATEAPPEAPEEPEEPGDTTPETDED